MTALERDLAPGSASGLPPPVLEQSRLGRLAVALFAVTVLALGGVTVWAVATRHQSSAPVSTAAPPAVATTWVAPVTTRPVPTTTTVPVVDAWRPASDEMVRRVDASLEAFNSGDVEAFGAMFREDGVFEEPQSPTAPTAGIVGREAIVKAMDYLHTMGARYHRTGPVAQNGTMVVFSVTCDTCPGFIGEIDAIVFDAAGLIVHYWTIVR